MPAFLKQLTWVEFSTDPKQDDTAYRRLKSGIEGKEPGFVPPTVQAAPIDLAALKIEPRGLRSFEPEDHPFFLKLVLGSRDQRGLPTVLRDWKRLVEQIDPDRTFRVAYWYGPSGCGKSSLVKAGLIPCLAEYVATVYVQAAVGETETRVLHELRKLAGALPTELGLADSMAWLAAHPEAMGGRKLLLVIDQFEQWLHAARGRLDGELATALRYCDGRHMQCLLLVRDEFTVAVHRFMKSLGCEVRENLNYQLIDLFDADFAREVLFEYGRGYGRLPDKLAELTTAQLTFLDRVIADLRDEDGKVVTVQLALLAQMLEGQAWTPAALDQIGGAAGIGRAFLEEEFDKRSASAECQLHRAAAIKVFEALLPHVGTAIKGRSRSRQDLLDASGYAQRPAEFEELVQLLDGQLRIITPVETDDGPGYQLTHDYLVPSLRDWLTAKQRATRRGRAQFRLIERSAFWNQNPENRYLPTGFEYLNIRFFTRSRDWTEAQRRMMRVAGRFLGVRLGAALLLLVVFGVVGWQYGVSQSGQRADGYVNAALNAPPDALPYALRDVIKLPDYVRPVLQKRFGSGGSTGSANDDLTPMQQLHGLCAFAAIGQVRVDELIGHVTREPFHPSAECANLVAALAMSHEAALQEIHRVADAEPKAEIKARLATVALSLGDKALASGMCEFGPDPTQRTVFIAAFPAWHQDLTKLATDIKGLELEKDPALLSALCLGVGSVAAADRQMNDVTALKPLLEGWYRTHTTSGVHSAAGWVLRQWQLMEPAIVAGDAAPEGSDWFVTKSALTMIRVPADEFVRKDDSDANAKPQTVELTRDLWLSDQEVSVKLFREFIDDKRYAEAYPNQAITTWEGEYRFGRAGQPERQPDHPVQQVGWDDAVKFCNWLSRREDLSVCYQWVQEAGGTENAVGVWKLDPAASGYRLPTEAEWEYACRAGAGIAANFSFGDSEKMLADYGWYDSNCGGKTHPIGSKMPNAWGLHDMHGNVVEWCQDWYYDQYSAGPNVDPMGPETGSLRVLRGGSWFDIAIHCHFSFRSLNEPELRDYSIGFRVART